MPVVSVAPPPPGEHGLQLCWPVKAWYVPSGQGEQPAAVAYVPGRQLVHAASPGLDDVPGAHARHTADPALDAYQPSGQLVHNDPGVDVFPAGQGVHADVVPPPTVDDVPYVQRLHAPPDVAYWPAGHAKQLLAAMPELRPAGHATHEPYTL